MVTQVSPARWDGLFAYPTVKLLTDMFLGKPHDGFLREEGQKFATTKYRKVRLPYGVRPHANTRRQPQTVKPKERQQKKKLFFQIAVKLITIKKK